MLKAEVLKAQLMDSLGTVRIMWCLNGQNNSQGRQFFVSQSHTVFFFICWNSFCLVQVLVWCSPWSDAVTYQASAFKLLSVMLLTLSGTRNQKSEAIWDSSVSITNPEAIIMIDLSYLTEEEQEMILAVLTRDAELKKLEEQRVKWV